MMRRWIVPVLLPLVGAALVLAGLISGGQWLRSQLKQHDRYTLAVADIDCSPPEGMERQQFLAEVAKQSGLDRLALLDDDLPPRLKTAFAQHPWVEEVEDVQVLPQRHIRVTLRYRVPVLAVPLAEGTRAVDRQGILLPVSAHTNGLPVWRGPVSLPTGPAGTAWGDGPLEAAAQVTGLLQPHQDKLHMAAALTTAGEVTLTTQSGSHIIWGRPAVKEKEGEATSSIKLERLLEHCRKYGDLDHPDGPCEHDVRPVGNARVRSVRIRP